MSESDGISEALDAELRAVVMATAQVAEHAARRAETRHRELERQEAAVTRHFAARRAADRDTARAAVAPTRDSRWWATAQLEQAVHAYATAYAWADHDPHLAGETERIAQRIQDRFGRDARVAMETAARTGRTIADPANARGRRPEYQAEQQYAAIATHDSHAVAAGGWDTSSRRLAFAETLGDIQDLAAVDARVRLDRARAHPASAAAVERYSSIVPAKPEVHTKPSFGLNR